MCLWCGGRPAGVAAAFRSPVGGVLFALEEMTSWFRNELLWFAFFTTAVVSVAGRASDTGPTHLSAAPLPACSWFQPVLRTVLCPQTQQCFCTVCFWAASTVRQLQPPAPMPAFAPLCTASVCCTHCLHHLQSVRLPACLLQCVPSCASARAVRASRARAASLGPAATCCTKSLRDRWAADCRA